MEALSRIAVINYLLHASVSLLKCALNVDVKGKKMSKFKNSIY